MGGAAERLARSILYMQTQLSSFLGEEEKCKALETLKSLVDGAVSMYHDLCDAQFAESTASFSYAFTSVYQGNEQTRKKSLRR